MTIQNKPTRSELIDLLKAVPLPHTRKNVRNYIPDSHFIPVFGTFSAFKEAAGLLPNNSEKAIYFSYCEEQ